MSVQSGVIQGAGEKPSNPALPAASAAPLRDLPAATPPKAP
jgi:hypothetical protein